MDSLLLNSIPLAHILIGSYFVFFGFWNIYHWYSLIEVLLEKHIPLPWLAMSFGIAWQVIAGFMIMFGIYVKFAALSLILFTLLAVYLFHHFWKFKGEHRKHSLILFVTNLSITLGALLLLLNSISPLTHVTDFFS